LRLPNALLRLPQRLDPIALSAEIGLVPDLEWIPSPVCTLGASEVPLVTVAGTANHDFAIAGPVKPTAALTRSPCLQEALCAFGVPVTRSRLVRLSPGASPELGVDWSYHGARHATICVPIIAEAALALVCGDETARLSAGEAWLLDTSRAHALHNPGERAAVHLIIETRALPRGVGRGPGPVPLEPYRFEVLTLAELATLTDEIVADLVAREVPEGARQSFTQTAALASRRYGEAFRRFGHESTGELAYRDILLDLLDSLRGLRAGVSERAATVIETMLLPSPPAPRPLHRPIALRRPSPPNPEPVPEFDRPIFIVSAPRSGSTLLFDLLARAPGTWTIGGESHEVIRSVPELHPAHRKFASDRLDAADATPAVVSALCAGFARRLVDREGRSVQAPTGSPAETGARAVKLRFLEKTPANALRIPFLREAFPGAFFVVLRREPRENISSLVEGWRSRRFISYRGLPGWPYRDWSFFLPPGWSSLEGRSLLEIAAYQWEVANATITADLSTLPRSQWCELTYDGLLAHPRQTLAAVVDLVGLSWDDELERAVSGELPRSRVTLSAPSRDKWRRHEAELDALLRSGASSARRFNATPSWAVANAEKKEERV
jgi:hypothetical protein